MRILAENTCLDHPVDTADMGMKYTGRITSPRDVRVAYVEQEPPMPADTTVADALLGVQGGGRTSNNNSNNKSVYAAVRRYRLAALHAHENPDAFAKATAEMET